MWGARGEVEASLPVEMLDKQDVEGGSSRACNSVLRYVLVGESVYAQGRTEYKVRAVHCVLLRSLNLLLCFFRKEVDVEYEMCHEVVNT